jgi:AbrB family looped-hinge helix DNA binding protein
MGTATVDERGRIIIPKEIRMKLGLRPDRRLTVELRGDEIVVRPLLGVEEVAKSLRGCVKGSKVKAEELRHIWGVDDADH